MPWLGNLAASWWIWISISGFLIAITIESARPDGRRRTTTLSRWLTHMGCYAASVLSTTAVLPVFLLALFTHRMEDGPERAFGWIDATGGPWAVLVVGLLGIDLIEYCSHWLEHRFQLLWRFHAVHHADPHMDASTALLHHPVAYLLTAMLIGIVMTLAGLPAWVFPVYGVFEIAGGVFQHIATPVPDRLERALRWLLVTPGMHQAHHSDDPRHHGTNFGSVLSVWDRLFGTLLILDGAQRRSITFGIGAVPGTALTQPGTWEHRPYGVLTLPFRMRFGDPVEQAAHRGGASVVAGTTQPVHET